MERLQQKKRFLAVAAILLLLSALGCAPDTPEAVSPAEETVRLSSFSACADGIYRGFYNDRGIEQLSVQFELQNGRFTSVVYNAINYKDGDYLAKNATDIQSQVASQYEEAAAYLVGKPFDAVTALLDPTDVTTDRDAVTSATLRTNKLASALMDGVNRGVLIPTATTVYETPGDYPDGVYRGFYYNGSSEQVFVEFSIENGSFTDVSLKELVYDGTDYLSDTLSEEQQTAANEYLFACKALTGKPVTALETLYTAVDAVSGATPPLSQLLSAIMEGFARNVYTPVETTALPQLSGYENGAYRGFYYEDGFEQISVQFELVNDTFVSVRFRGMNYTDGSYLCEEPTAAQSAVYHQYLALAEHLTGKRVAALYDLYDPASIVSDADGCSAATLPSSKLVSALMDGLTRGLYMLEGND